MAEIFGERLGNDELQTLADNLPIPCWIASATGSNFWFNRHWHEYCGTTADQMAFGGWKSVHDPEALPDILSSWETAFVAGQPFQTTLRLKGEDGIFRSFLTKVEPTLNSDNELVRWVGVHTDISEQLDAESKLKVVDEAERQRVSFREAILSQLAEGLIIADAQGRIVFVNQAANDLHGVVKLDVAPEEYAESYSLFTEAGEPHPAMTLPLSRAVANEETVIGARWRIRRPDGKEVLALGNAQPVYAPDGEKLGAVLTIQDDTARHTAELALAEALAIKDALLFEVNHRVKNSLQIVNSLLTMQAQRSQSKELKDKLKEACNRVDVITRLHQHLYQHGSHNRVNLGSYIREFVHDGVRAFSEGDEIDIRFADNTDVEVEMDRAVSIALIIGELLTNAMKYAFQDKYQNEISVSISMVERDLEIVVSDNGIGLPDGFDPASNTGFGMKIVSSLLHQLSGTMSMVEQEKGTGFKIRFPVSPT